MENKTYVYFIYDKSSRLFKIGKSYDPEKRISFLSISNNNLKLIYYTDKYTERELHQKYKEYRVYGEWFALSKKILFEIIGSNKNIPKTFFYKVTYDKISEKHLKQVSHVKTITVTTKKTYNIVGVIKGHPDYCFTECKNVINMKRNSLIKKTFSGMSKGWYLISKFINELEIKTIELPCVCPF